MSVLVITSKGTEEREGFGSDVHDLDLDLLIFELGIVPRYV
jgi:hypothetical protein